MKYFKMMTMKKSAIIFIVFLMGVFQSNAQDNRAGILEAKEQSVGLATGMDYSILPVEINYKRGVSLFNYKYPVSVGASVTIPMFDFDLNDIRVRLTSETTILRKGNFDVRGGIDPLLVNVKMQTETMTSLGADFHIFTGLTNQKWNAGLELNYNQIFSSYIKHTDKYRENVFMDVVDGWYKNTASNLKIGVLAGRSFNKFDIYLNIGISKTGKFNNYLFVPTYYALLGANYTF